MVGPLHNFAKVLRSASKAGRPTDILWASPTGSVMFDNCIPRINLK